MQRFVAGLLVGLLIGAVGPALAYYRSYTNVSELRAGDVEGIIEGAIKDALNDCSLRLSETRGEFSCY